MDEEKKLSPVTLAAGAVASVTSMLVGSLLGDAGTLLGAAVGSITYSAGAFWYEHGARKAHAKLTARKAQDVAHAQPGKHPLQVRQSWTPGRRIATIAGTLALCICSALVTLVAIEGATGKTLSSSFGGPAQYGTTIGGYTTKSPASSPPPQPSSESPSAMLSGSPSLSSGTVSPTGISASPDASPSSSPSVTSASPVPDATPDMSPSSTLHT